MAELAMAARVGDPISHSPMTGLALAGIAIGLVVGVAIVAVTIGTGGADVIVAAGLAAFMAAFAGAISTICVGITLGFFLGKLASWLASGLEMLNSVTGEITTGAATVFIGPGKPAAARYQDSIKCQEPPATYIGATLLGNIICPGVGALVAAGIVYAYSAHDGATVAQGSKTVLTEGKSQSRVKDKTSCGGTISKGCDSVFVGGPPNAEVSWDAEVPQALTTVVEWIDKLGVAAGLLSGGAGLWKGILEEGWRLGLSNWENELEFGLGVIDTAAYTYEQYYKRQLEELEKMDKTSPEYKEKKESMERARTTFEAAVFIHAALNARKGRE